MLEGMRIHLVFYILLLEPTPPNVRLGLIEIDHETQQLYYKVEKIIGFKLISNKPHYLVY
jgi:hypothetical protein